MNLTELLTGTDMTLELVIWSMFAGIVAASFMAVYNRRVNGKNCAYSVCARLSQPVRFTHA